MISTFKQIEDLFREIDSEIKGKINIYMIGGAALLFRGLKGSTKDIDIIVKSSEEKMHLENALNKNCYFFYDSSTRNGADFFKFKRTLIKSQKLSSSNLSSLASLASCSDFS